jgi:hypothetical protein
MASTPGKPSDGRSLASIAAMPYRRSIIAALALAGASVFAAGCGDSGPDPSIPQDDSAGLLAKVQEIQANVDNGSCFVAADRTDDLISDVQDLPSSVDPDVQRALENGANQLKILLQDPDQCEARTTTTEPTTTEESTTESTTSTTRTQPTTSTTRTQTQQTQTQQTQTTETAPSGGVSPGSPQGGL